MYKLFGYWRSAAAFRVRAALNLKGLAFEETMVDLGAGDQHRPNFKAVNPAASVPALIVDDGPPLTQSIAILEYLEEKHAEVPLLPGDARGRARVRALALILAADYHPLFVFRIGSFLAETFGIDSEGQLTWARHWIREGLVQVEARLADDPETGRFCHGDAPTIADLCLMSQVWAARSFGVSLDDMPTVTRIAEACDETEAIAKASPLAQPGAPT